MCYYYNKYSKYSNTRKKYLFAIHNKFRKFWLNQKSAVLRDTAENSVDLLCERLHFEGHKELPVHYKLSITLKLEFEENILAIFYYFMDAIKVVSAYW